MRFMQKLSTCNTVAIDHAIKRTVVFTLVILTCFQVAPHTKCMHNVSNVHQQKPPIDLFILEKENALNNPFVTMYSHNIFLVKIIF